MDEMCADLVKRTLAIEQDTGQVPLRARQLIAVARQLHADLWLTRLDMTEACLTARNAVLRLAERNNRGVFGSRTS
jgi:hypothetical protein